MRKSSLALHYQAYFHAATLGAESNFRHRGFRQKDFRFLLELFANWMECSLPGGGLGLHNAQVARYLEDTAASYHRFYDTCRVLPMGDEEPGDLHRARLLLGAATRTVLANGLGLLGVSAPDRM